MKPQRKIGSTGKGVTSLCAALVVSGILLLPGKGVAQNFTISNGGSTATLNLGDGSGGTGSIGMNSWTVGGVAQDQLDQQWFWYSIGNSAPQSIDNLGDLTTLYNGPNNLTVTYGAADGLQVNVDYVLHGNGANSGSADMMEYIWIVNNSGSAINNFSFYQYSNFNLLQNNLNSVTISGPAGAYTGAFQQTGVGGTGIAEVIVSPDANGAEAGLAAPTLSDVSTGTLNGNSSAGPGDVAWAFRWDDLTLAANGGELDISKDKGLKVMTIPEPSTLALIALGIGALGLTLRRKLA